MITKEDIQRHKDTLAEIVLARAEHNQCLYIQDHEDDDATTSMVIRVPLGILRELREGPTRKPHVHLDQDDVMMYLLRPQAIRGLTLAEIATHFDVSAGTAQRKLDGLFRQGKLGKLAGTVQLLDIYFVP